MTKQGARIDLSHLQKRHNRTNHEVFGFGSLGSKLSSNRFGLHGSAHMYDNNGQDEQAVAMVNDDEEMKFDDRSEDGAHSSSIESNHSL